MKQLRVDGRLDVPPEVAKLLRDIVEVLNRINRQVVICYGTPEGAVVGSRGQLAMRLDGGASTVLYVKESGDGTNTGWVAK